MSEKDLSKNIEYVKDHCDELFANHRGKYVLIHDGAFVSVYDDYRTAASEGIRLFGIHDGFLVQHISEEDPTNIILSVRSGSMRSIPSTVHTFPTWRKTKKLPKPGCGPSTVIRVPTLPKVPPPPSSRSRK